MDERNDEKQNELSDVNERVENGPAASVGGDKKRRKPLAIFLFAVMAIAVAAIICVMLFLPPKDSGDVYKLAELEANKIDSIASYNADTDSDFKYLSLNSEYSLDAAAYSSDGAAVMLSERIASADGSESIVFYALKKGARVDILDSFFSDSYSGLELNGVKLTFLIKSDEAGARYTTRFQCVIGGNAYYVECVSSSSGRWTELARQLTVN